MGRYEGCMESPWDDISIQYVLVCTHVAKKRYVEAFKEESQLVTSVFLFSFCFFFLVSLNTHFCRLFLRFFTENRGWTLPALFSILRDLRDLAFDVGSFIIYKLRFRRLIFLAGRLPCKIQWSEERMHGRISSNHCQSIWKLYDRQVPAFQHTVYFLILVEFK